METLVNVGQGLTLNAQLSDGTLSLPKKVKAILKDPNATVLQTVELNHIGDGLFLNTSFVMPEIPFITAQYFVFQQDGTTIDRGYTASLNVFRNSTLIGLGGGSSSSTVTELTADIDQIQREFIVEVSDVSP